MPRSKSIVARPCQKNGLTQYCVTTPADLFKPGRRKRVFFPDPDASKAYINELLFERESSAPSKYWHRLTEKEQIAMIHVLGRVHYDVLELCRLVEIGLRHTAAVQDVALDFAIEQFLEAKESEGISKQHLTNYRGTLSALLGQSLMASDLRSGMLDDWLSGFKDPKTRNNKRGEVRTFLKWCQARQYISPDARFDLSRAIVPAKDVAVLTPKQMAELLKAAKAHQGRATAVPCIVLSGFAGLRNKEAATLHWEDVKLADNPHVVVRPTRTKRVRRTVGRVVPLQPNAVEWLKPYAKKRGPITKLRPRRVSQLIVEIAGLAKIKHWPQHGLRHSYTSYRVAATGDESKTAAEIGDLVSTMKRHYKLAVSPELGKEWFAIGP